MEELLNTENAVQSPVVAETVPPKDGISMGEREESQELARPAQDAETNARYARIRRTAEAEANRRVRETLETLQAEVAQLRQREAQTVFEEHLAQIKAVYPEETANRIEELGDTYLGLMSAGGVSPLAAYEAARAEAKRRELRPSMGEVKSSAPGQGSYFSREEVRRMKKSEISANYDAIRQSMNHW